MTTSNREDYILAILEITEEKGIGKTTEIAQLMKVSPASVSEMLKILNKEGLVEYAKYRGVKLTEKGLTEARLTRKRHHVVEKFLIDILDMDPDAAHEEASRIEHSISDDATINMCNMLGNPPDCDCQCCVNPCKAVSTTGINITTQLSDMRPGDKGKMSHLKSDDTQAVKRLLGMGFVPGRSLILDSKESDESPLVVIIGDKTVVMEPELAPIVYVSIGAQ